MFNLETLVIVCAWIGGIVTVFAIASPFLHRDMTSSRLRSVAMRREELSRQQKERVTAPTSARFQTSARVSLMKKILERLKLQNKTTSNALRERLAQAGMRGQGAVITFVFMRLFLPIAVATAVFLLLSGSEMKMPIKMLLIGFSAVIGFYLPGVFVTNIIQKRQQVLKVAFPDAVDLLLICVEAGLSIEAAFARVTEEMMETTPLLAEELGLTSAELAFLPDRKNAYENLTKRTGLEVAKSLAMALIQSEKYGTPVAVALRVVSQESRDSRMAQAEKKAGALPAQLTVPMIVFFLPVLFVVILGPAIIQVMQELL